ncbi:MAG: hypothetical protein O7G85_04475 [Planctomycetota bacterium]|nr:hypothetical protein [Planctomycetota bacterium]
MASRSKKKKNKTSLRDRLTDSLASINWPDPKQSLRFGTWVVGVGGLVASWILGVPKLQAYVAQHQPVQELEVRFTNPPVWMNGDLEAWLVLTVHQQLISDPQDRGTLTNARHALLETGCFDDVLQVRRTALNEIEVDAVFMQPFAVVVDQQGEHLVDPRGRLLPAGYRIGPSSHFIRIIGTAFQRPTNAGESWRGADLSSALHIIRMIDDHTWWRQIKTLNVQNIEMITMSTRHGCRIIWGGAPGEEAIGEVTAEQKIGRLTYIDKNYGRIDVDCPNELDITDPKVVTAR